MPHALVAGCGDVGTRAGSLLAAAGWTVTGLRRAGDLPSPLAVHHADLTRPETLRGLPAVDLVLYLPTPDLRTEQAYRALFVDGPAALLAALPRRPARLVFVSSTAVYGDLAGAWADEDTPAVPEGFNGAVLLEAERRLAAGPVPTVVARLAGIYGPGRDWLLLRRVRDRVPCRADAWTNRIHAHDAARMLVHLATLDHPAPCYLGVDDLPATECEVLGWLAARMGLPAPPPGAAAGSGMAAGNRRFRNARLRASGFRFDYPDYRTGYAPLTPGGTASD